MIDNKNQILLELHLCIYQSRKTTEEHLTKNIKNINHNKLVKRKTKNFGYKLYTSKTKILCTIDLT